MKDIVVAVRLVPEDVELLNQLCKEFANQRLLDNRSSVMRYALFELAKKMGLNTEKDRSPSE